ncbi:uncharacterized protein C18orf19 homolog A-like isoform X1 [Eurytemora carolleeae]|uniref:uncharacterized protein C18orf19 homolog A-like isoform X1 n=1 Tax=Eurytemora carolleeae TaxID=1294199 RepID=UPI000C75CE5B|nr:uncharacterized protein C18orf19 homolog A-like isoform X1 [Eurytemora carolleeae]|eukprot:XP_023338457.1 uncharacterized protein C18orf19 homolog A-like isoform X1 [Eurytemora affinis]
MFRSCSRLGRTVYANSQMSPLSLHSWMPVSQFIQGSGVSGSFSHPSLLRQQNKQFSLLSSLQSSGTENKKIPEKLGIVAKFKKMAKDYWYVLIPVHVATSIVWYGGFYLLAKSGVDLIAILETCSVPESVIDRLRGSEAGYYALAYACYKVATPIRYTVTVGGTTFTITKLTQMGYLSTSREMATKVKDKADEMNEIYQTKKEDIKEKYEERKDKFKDDWESAWVKYSKRKQK